MKKVAIRCVFLAILLYVMTPAAFAEELEFDADIDLERAAIADEIAGFQAAIPDEVATLLPEDFFSEPLDASYALMDGATVIVGHAPTKSGKIEYGEGSIFIDCGAGEGGKLGCLRLEDGKEFYA